MPVSDWLQGDDLAYRNERVQSIEAHTVYENDVFDYELG